MMLTDVKKAPGGICPYCSRWGQASLLTRRWFRRNQYLCAHPDCKKVVYICLSTSCNNYVKSEKKSRKYCDVCCSGYAGDTGGDGGGDDSYLPSEQREHMGSRHKTSNDISSDNTFTDSGGDGGGGD